jgi:nucleotide-binding universal stress UspA family protein
VTDGTPHGGADGQPGAPAGRDSSGRRTIAVGVDGSADAAQALDWAVREARLRGTSLQIVSVWTDPYRNYVADVDSTPDLDEKELVLARSSWNLAKGAAHRVQLLEPELDVSTLVVEGGPAHRLIEASWGAELLVLGTRGRGGFLGLVLGSVSQQCIAHAHCPVVVVRAIHEEAE